MVHLKSIQKSISVSSGALIYLIYHKPSQITYMTKELESQTQVSCCYRYKLHCNVMLCLEIFYCAYCVGFSQTKYTASFSQDLTNQQFRSALTQPRQMMCIKVCSHKPGRLLSADHRPLKKSSQLTLALEESHSSKSFSEPIQVLLLWL